MAGSGLPYPKALAHVQNSKKNLCTLGVRDAGRTNQSHTPAWSREL